MVIAYLMQEHSMSLFNALSHTRKRRPIIFPNPGFQKQLFDFERRLQTQLPGAASRDSLLFFGDIASKTPKASYSSKLLPSQKRNQMTSLQQELLKY
jgi:Dual specificity phosphatase, catalytic domain